MKKLFLSVLFVAFTYTTWGQLSIQVGGNYSFVNKREQIKVKWDPGFHAGFSYDLGRVVVFQPGLYFQQKGFRYQSTVVGQDLSFRYNLNYLEMPLNLIFKVHFGQVKVFAGLGITGSIGLFGREKSDIAGIQTERKIRFDGEAEQLGEKDAHFERFDWGAQALLGVQIYRFAITFTYNNGFANIQPNKEAAVLHNRTLSLNLSYRFRADPEKKRR